MGEKFDHYYKVEFCGKSNDDSLDAFKRYNSDPKMANHGLIWAKNSKFEQEEKLDRQFEVKIHGKSNGDSLDAL